MPFYALLFLGQARVGQGVPRRTGSQCADARSTPGPESPFPLKEASLSRAGWNTDQFIFLCGGPVFSEDTSSLLRRCSNEGCFSEMK